MIPRKIHILFHLQKESISSTHSGCISRSHTSSLIKRFFADTSHQYFKHTLFFNSLHLTSLTLLGFFEWNTWCPSPLSSGGVSFKKTKILMWGQNFFVIQGKKLVWVWVMQKFFLGRGKSCGIFENNCSQKISENCQIMVFRKFHKLMLSTTPIPARLHLAIRLHLAVRQNNNRDFLAQSYEQQPY